MERVIVTGATSMLGIAFIYECLARGVKVVAVIRPNSENRERIPMNNLVQIVECELCGLKNLPNLVEGLIDAFYHFGWDHTDQKNRYNVFYQNLNIDYTLDAVMAAKQLGCTVFIGAGSQAEYGLVESVISPETPVDPNFAYGVAKYAAGKMSGLLCNELGIRHVWARIFSVYGPYDHPHTLIMTCITEMLKGKCPKLTKCEQQWDYLYSADAADAFYLLGRSQNAKGVYCLGSGKGRPLIEYVECIRDSINPDLELDLGAIPYGPNQVMHLVADLEKLERDTVFWQRRNFTSGIKSTIQWFSSNH